MRPDHKHVLWCISQLSPASQEPIVSQRIKDLVDREVSDEELRPALHEILDMCVNGSLTSDLVVTALDMVWQQVGGTPDDPAPWRDKYSN